MSVSLIQSNLLCLFRVKERLEILVALLEKEYFAISHSDEHV
jgi:hypothetical protein